MTGIDVSRASATVPGQVQSFQHTVALDVGVDDRRNARVLETAGEIGRCQLTRFGPAFDRDLATLGVDADRNLTGERLARRANEGRIAHRDGAEDDTRDSLAEPGRDRCQIADAATELSRDGDVGEDALYRRYVRRLTRKRSIQIDDV